MFQVMGTHRKLRFCPPRVGRLILLVGSLSEGLTRGPVEFHRSLRCPFNANRCERWRRYVTQMDIPCHGHSQVGVTLFLLVPHAADSSPGDSLLNSRMHTNRGPSALIARVAAISPACRTILVRECGVSPNSRESPMLSQRNRDVPQGTPRSRPHLLYEYLSPSTR